MDFSVAMCTYEGGLYLREQLQSIAAQEALPREVVVCDDASMDNTWSILEDFARHAPFEVRRYSNPQRLGCRDNFARAVGLCRHEWILLCDQDDVWLPQKVRRLQETLEARPDADLVFSDAQIVGAQRESLGYTLWEALAFGRVEQLRAVEGKLLDVLLKRNVVTGATAAFRASLAEVALPIPKGWVHDGWIALVAAALRPAALVDEPLIEYRQHPGQQIGQPRRSLYQQYLRGKAQGPVDFERVASNYAAARDRLAQFPDRLLNPEILDALQAKIDHFRTKATMRRYGPRLSTVVRELIRCRYRRYSAGWKSLAQDLFL